MKIGLKASCESSGSMDLLRRGLRRVDTMHLLAHGIMLCFVMLHSYNVEAQFTGDLSQADACTDLGSGVECNGTQYADIYIANPANCTTYFVCIDNLLYLESCLSPTDMFDYVRFHKCMPPNSPIPPRCRPNCLVGQFGYLNYTAGYATSTSASTTNTFTTSNSAITTNTTKAAAPSPGTTITSTAPTTTPNKSTSPSLTQPKTTPTTTSSVTITRQDSTTKPTISIGTSTVHRSESTEPSTTKSTVPTTIKTTTAGSTSTLITVPTTTRLSSPVTTVTPVVPSTPTTKVGGVTTQSAAQTTVVTSLWLPSSISPVSVSSSKVSDNTPLTTATPTGISTSTSPAASTTASTAASTAASTTKQTAASTAASITTSLNISTTTATSSLTSTSAAIPTTTSSTVSTNASTAPSPALSSAATTPIEYGIPMVTLTPGTPGVIMENQTAPFDCSFQYRFPPSPFVFQNFEWTLNGLNVMTVASSKRVVVTYLGVDSFGVYRSSLLLQPVQLLDAGKLRCYADYGGAFTIYNSSQLQVIPLPVVVISPLTLSVYQGSVFTLSCMETDDGYSLEADPIFYWFKEDILLQPGANTSITSPNSRASQLEIRMDALVDSRFSCMIQTTLRGNSSRTFSAVNVLHPQDTSCAQVFDSNTNITWGQTKSGITSIVACPPSQIGFASRKCQNLVWMPSNFNNCVDKVLGTILNKIGQISDGIGLNNSAYVANVALSLKNFTDTTTGLTVGNLNASVNAIGQFAQLRSSNASYTVDPQEISTMVSSLSNVMEPSNNASWETLLEMSPNISVIILSSTDVYGRILAESLSSGSTETIERNNLILQASSVNKDELTGDLVYPQNGLSTNDRILVSRKTINSADSDDTSLTISSSYYSNLNQIMPVHFPINSFIASRIISLTIDQLTGKVLTPKVNITLYHDEYDNTTRQCVFWDYKSPNGGAWSDAGCVVIDFNNTFTLCECDHLTNFAILFSRSVNSTSQNDIILSLISIIGCSISIGAMVLTIISYAIMWKHVRSHHAVVLLNLCIALIIANIIFLAGVDKTQPPVLCKVISILLHYFFLAAFFMMLAEGVEMLMYIMFVFHIRRKYETALLILAAWFVPLVIVAVSLGITLTEGYGGKFSCWLSIESGLIWAFVGPALFVILVNLVIIIVILVRISKSKFKTDKTNEKKNRIHATMWNIIVMSPILGTTWVFGVLSLIWPDTVAFQYLFAIANSLQGLFIFIFHSLCNGRKIKKKSSKSGSSGCFGRSRTRTPPNSGSSRPPSNNTAAPPHAGSNNHTAFIVPKLVQYHTDMQAIASGDTARIVGNGDSTLISSGDVTRIRMDSSSSNSTTMTSLMNSLHSSTITGRSNGGTVNAGMDDSDEIFSVGSSTIIPVNRRIRGAMRNTDDTQRIIPEELTTF